MLNMQTKNIEKNKENRLFLLQETLSILRNDKNTCF